ncbi:MAG: IS200/IS605 family transposase [Pyrinomonadaceae bacterium]|nr:IS200/IS605 family transposase [Pyrinomonadaceae bacterium]
MANTYSSLFYHLVFSTKYRKRHIFPNIEERVWRFIAGVARKNKITPIKLGGIEDHLHSLVLSPPKYSPSQIVQMLKIESSRWFHEELGKKSFGWQNGYAAFSVNKRSVPRVVAYIENQREHHQKFSFEDEYKELLRLHEVDIVDERYLFG